MVIITVTKKTYKKGSSWTKLSIDESNNLIASVDIEDDEDCPVEEISPGEFVFREDFTCYFYYLASDEETDEKDFAVLEYLRDMRSFDPKELRYWFHDLKIPGDYILETSWTTPDIDGDTDSNFIKTYAADVPLGDN